MGLESKEEVPVTLIDGGVVLINPDPQRGQASNVVDQLVQSVAKTYSGDTLNEPPYYLTSNFAPIRHESTPTNILEINGEIPDLFTLRIHGGRRFRKFSGSRIYVGGWVRLVNGCSAKKFGMLRLCDISGELGISGLSYY
ncbi:hypothetical protein LIER_02426 [Lithospermum erythrorhizon]|uniref:Uncharacterized protein n=1 Tax=Lithospermum erythrorhizon TaxID=34254 RepID=A0AAV3NQY1_LITER